MDIASVDILAIGAHPDDVEFGCGGILAKMAAQGKSIVIVDATLGEKGTNGNPQLRKEEGERAAALIGAQRVYLDFKDCEVIDSYQGRLEFVKLFRTFRPKLVLAPMWKGVQNHPDHLACGTMARYACRYARFAKILPDLPIHRVQGILHYMPPEPCDPDFLIDVSEVLDTWKRMMGSHSSQMKTYDFIDWNLRMASRFGMMIGCSHAQGLIKGNAVQIEDLLTIAKGTQEI